MIEFLIIAAKLAHAQAEIRLKSDFSRSLKDR